MSYDENWTLDSRVSGARVAFDHTVRRDWKSYRDIDDIRDSKRLHFSRRVGDRVFNESEREYSFRLNTVLLYSEMREDRDRQRKLRRENE